MKFKGNILKWWILGFVEFGFRKKSYVESHLPPNFDVDSEFFKFKKLLVKIAHKWRHSLCSKLIWPYLWLSALLNWSYGSVRWWRDYRNLLRNNCQPSSKGFEKSCWNCAREREAHETIQASHIFSSNKWYKVRNIFEKKNNDRQLKCKCDLKTIANNTKYDYIQIKQNSTSSV